METIRQEKEKDKCHIMKRQNSQAPVIELLPSSEQIEAASRWQDLEQSIRNTGLTNSWPWIKTWLDNYHDILQPTFAFGKQGSQPIGAALITKATHRIRGIPFLLYIWVQPVSRKKRQHVQNIIGCLSPLKIWMPLRWGLYVHSNNSFAGQNFGWMGLFLITQMH